MSYLTDVLGITGLSADAERFYTIIKNYTDNHFGNISGKDNIIFICGNEFTEEEIISFCHTLAAYKNGFRYQELSYHGQPYIQNIWIDIVYDQFGNKIS